MEAPCNEIQEAINKILDYNFNDEKKHYEEENDIEITDEHYEDPDLLEDKNHIFYSILVVQQYLNS